MRWFQAATYWGPRPSRRAKRLAREFSRSGLADENWCIIVEIRFPQPGVGIRECVASWEDFKVRLDGDVVHHFNLVFHRAPFVHVLDEERCSPILEFGSPEMGSSTVIQRARSRVVVVVVWPATVLYRSGFGPSPSRIECYRPSRINRALA
jgi:hypothetical protein